jgi:hypothetical protein
MNLCVFLLGWKFVVWRSDHTVARYFHIYTHTKKIIDLRCQIKETFEYEGYVIFSKKKKIYPIGCAKN